MRVDRRAFGLDLRLAEFLIVAPILCVFAFAAWTGLTTTIRLDGGQGLGAFWAFLVGGAWVMAVHYLVATIPSVLAWILAFGGTRALGFSDAAAVRVAAPVTALVASLMLLAWLRDEDYRAMIPTIALISVLVSTLVALRLRLPPK